MSDSPKISDAVALEARTFLEGVANGSIVIKDKGDWNRLNAAKDLYRFYQAQEKFGREKIAQLARTDNPSADVRDYENLDDDALNAKVIAIRGRQAG